MSSTKSGIVKTVIGICIFMAIVVGMFAYQMSKPRVMTVQELVNNGAITYEEPRSIKPFALVDHTGEPFTNEDLQGQWTLLFFGFTNCGGFCPATLALLNSLYNELNAGIHDNTQVLMITVDPARDTPPVLSDYMARFNKDFVGVTGDFLQIRLLSDQFHIGIQKMVGEDENYHVQHGEQIILVNPDGQYHGFFKPPFTLARLKTTYQSIVISH